MPNEPPKLGLSITLGPSGPFQYGMEGDGVHVEIILNRKLSLDEFLAIVDALETQLEEDNLSNNSTEEPQMKPTNFPGRKQRRQYEAALRKQKRGSSRSEKETAATAAAIARGSERI